MASRLAADAPNLDEPLVGYMWLNSAIKITKGMGTPRSKSKIDRIAGLLI